jgi:hypothetical protein
MRSNNSSLWIGVLLLFLTACGGGGAGGTSGGSSTGGSGSLPPTRPSATISGVAYDAAIIDGNVTIYSFENGTKGAVLGEGRTDYQGNYSVSINAPSQPILVEITGGRYVEEASGLNVTLHSAHGLRAVTSYSVGTPISINVTYYTQLAAALAGFYINQGQGVSTAISNANARISALTGFPILTTRPVDVTDVANASASLTPSLQYGFLAAAISQWTLNASRTNGTADHSIHNSITFANLAYDDLLADGVLDGLGTAGPLSVGTIPLSADVYRHGLAVGALQFVQGSRNRTGLATTGVLTFVKTFNDSTNEIFGARTVIALDENGPTISNMSPTNNAYRRGTFQANATITDIVGLTNVVWKRNGTTLGSVANLADPRFTIDSSVLSDGDHTLTVEATNLLNTVQSASITVRVDNTAPTLSATSITPVNNGSAYCRISGPVSDPTTGVASLSVDGIPVTVSGSSWSYDKPVSGGPSSASAYVVDNAGNSRVVTISFSSAGWTMGGGPFQVSQCQF